MDEQTTQLFARRCGLIEERSAIKKRAESDETRSTGRKMAADDSVAD